ncbi:hypothetical protein C8J57DRAFT_1240194 [Mycena rebaudengoi]|nr:hypothetical protein C8J57DRAFT_1240194 [Mycena rebaudengoi]
MSRTPTRRRRTRIAVRRKSVHGFGPSVEGRKETRAGGTAVVVRGMWRTARTAERIGADGTPRREDLEHRARSREKGPQRRKNEESNDTCLATPPNATRANITHYMQFLEVTGNYYHHHTRQQDGITIMHYLSHNVCKREAGVRILPGESSRHPRFSGPSKKKKNWAGIWPGKKNDPVADLSQHPRYLYSPIEDVGVVIRPRWSNGEGPARLVPGLMY